MLLVLFFAVRGGLDRSATVKSLQIADIGRYAATIRWKTDRAVIGSVKYRSTGAEFSESMETAAGTEHEIKIGGLQADTIYDYYLNDSDDKYSFKTAPNKNTAFRFMVHHENDLLRSGDWRVFDRSFNLNLPDFAVVLNGGPAKAGEHSNAELTKLSDIGSKALIHYMNQIGELKVFAYGNSDFLLIHPDVSEQAVAAQVKASSANHLFIISSDTNQTRLKNRMQTDARIVLICPGGAGAADGTLTLPISEQDLVIDVDGDGVVATRIALDNSTTDMVTLKETPESVKRSCVYCRKLLEAKKYEDSITWYRDFIEKYRTKYIVDDAQFQLASIYDRHLYDYSKALAEYDRLLEQFPDSTKAEQVRQRIEYITGYNDYDFIPLASFEKTKSETYKTDKTEAIQTVENLVEKYPDAKIRNKMLFWLGHVLSQDNPDQSIYYHRELISASSGDEKKEALISMGDVYYTYKQYPDAICAYTDALGVGDSKYNFGVEDKINKSIRNITRERVLKAILVLLGLLFIGAVLIKPLFFTKAEVLRTGILLLVLLLFAYSVWRIFYRNYPEVAAFIPALFLTLSASHLISAVYSRKVFSKYPAAVNLICTSLGFVLLNIMLYYVFLYYHHFLPSVGL